MSAGTKVLPTDNDEGKDNVATPTVTITVSGSPVTVTPLEDKDTLREGLHMVYAQAVKGDERRQWIVFPPPTEVLGAGSTEPGVLLMLARHQEFKGNRTKWFESKVTKATLGQELARFAGDGWTPGCVVAVPLELDDYLAVWQGTTPHKAIRAVNRQLEAAYGVTVK